MKKNILLLTLALVLPIAQSNCQTAATLLATTVSPSGGTIAAAGSYYLGFDVTGNITIGASNVILDLNGHTVTGEITASSRSQVTIMNGHVTAPPGTPANITFNECNNIQLNNLSILQDSDIAIHIDSGTHVSIQDVTIETQSDLGFASTIRLSACSQSAIKNCVLTRNAGAITHPGMVIDNCTNVSIQDCCVAVASVAYSVTNGSNEIIISDCFAVDSGFGFATETPTKLLRCIAAKCVEGFFLQDDSASYLERCIADSCIRGFCIPCNQSHTVRQCVAFGNVTGFLCSGGGSDPHFIGNFANNNATNYDPIGSPIFSEKANQFTFECEDEELVCFRKEFRQPNYWRNVTRAT